MLAGTVVEVPRDGIHGYLGSATGEGRMLLGLGPVVVAGGLGDVRSLAAGVALGLGGFRGLRVLAGLSRCNTLVAGSLPALREPGTRIAFTKSLLPGRLLWSPV